MDSLKNTERIIVMTVVPKTFWSVLTTFYILTFFFFPGFYLKTVTCFS